MENPHEAEQAVLLERIIKNVVSQAGLPAKSQHPTSSASQLFLLHMS
jgi:hypothetical protein